MPQFLRCDRPRTNKAHLAAQHIPKLWQFIKAGAAEPTAQRRDPRIGSQFLPCAPLSTQFRISFQHLPERLSSLWGHAPQFVTAERPAPMPDTRMAVESGAAVLQTHRSPQHSYHWQCKRGRADHQGNVQNPLATRHIKRPPSPPNSAGINILNHSVLHGTMQPQFG